MGGRGAQLEVRIALWVRNRKERLREEVVEMSLAVLHVVARRATLETAE